MIYDIQSNELNSVCDVNGTLADQVYDIDGNPLMESSAGHITVMTYNYQWCTKINSQEELQVTIMNKYKPDIIGLQEAGNHAVKEFPSLAQQFLANYPYKYLSEHYNFNGMVSRIALEDVTDTDYTEYDDEYWDYQKCYLYIGSQKVAWFNTHLTWRQDEETLLRKYAQAHELFLAVQQEPYAIVTGDFNMYGLSWDSPDYIGVGKEFADAGYNMANWKNGFTKTYASYTTATSLDDLTKACDNIITSSNITIERAVVDTTKFSYLDGNSIDHMPVVAYLSIAQGD